MENALGSPNRLVGSHSHSRARRNILSLDRPFEHFERRQRLVEGHFVATVVYPDEREFAALLDLAVHDPVRSLHVGVAGTGESRRLDLVGNDFASQPVAVVVRVAGIHRDGDALSQQFSDVFDRHDFSIVVAGRAERCADG